MVSLRSLDRGILLFLFLGTLHAFTKVGTTAGTFLKINMGARAASLAGAFVAIADDGSAPFYNPAGTAFLNGWEMEGSITSWFAQIKLYNFSLIKKLSSHEAAGISLINVRSGRMEVTTIYEPEGTGQFFEATSLSLGIFYSRKLYDRLSIGGQIKLLEEAIYHERARGIAFDVGTYFRTGWQGLVIGMCLQNFGEKMKLEGEDLHIYADPYGDIGGNPPQDAMLRTETWSLPLIFRVGLSMRNKNYTLSLEGVHNSEGREKILAGLEFNLKPLSLRAGYKLLEDKGGLTLGFGLEKKKGGRTFKINYAYENWGILGGVHRFELDLK